MPRRRVAERRPVLPDPVYNSPLVTKFINGIMWGGKRSIAEKTFYRALQQVGEKAGEEPLKVFKRAIDNVRPTVEVTSRRRIHLSSSGRSSSGTPRRLGHTLDCSLCTRPRRKDDD